MKNKTKLIEFVTIRGCMIENIMGAIVNLLFIINDIGLCLRINGKTEDDSVISMMFKIKSLYTDPDQTRIVIYDSSGKAWIFNIGNSLSLDGNIILNISNKEFHILHSQEPWKKFAEKRILKYMGKGESVTWNNPTDVSDFWIIKGKVMTAGDNPIETSLFIDVINMIPPE